MSYNFNQLGSDRNLDAILYGADHGATIEASQMAEDLHALGSLAVASERAAAVAVGADANISELMPNPISEKMLEPKKVYVDDDWKETETRPDPVLARLSNDIETDREQLEDFANANMPEGQARGYLSSLISRARDTLHGPGRGNARPNHVIDQMKLPPFLRAVKERATYDDMLTGEEIGNLSWRDYLATASDHQLTNFLQWYKGEVTKVTTPEGREAEVAKVKDQYLTSMGALVDAGWLSPVISKHAAKKVEKVSIFFRSPFSSDGMDSKGSHSARGRYMILSLGYDRDVSDHELTHAVAGVDTNGLISAVNTVAEAEGYGDEQLEASVLFLKTMIEESAAVHMENSMNHGEPGIMSPKLRKAQGVETANVDAAYNSYLEAMSVLLEGIDGRGHMDQRTMSIFYSSLAVGKFQDLTELFAELWGGEDVMTEVIKVVLESSGEDIGVTDPIKADSISPVISEKVKVATSIRDLLVTKQMELRESENTPLQPTSLG